METLSEYKDIREVIEGNYSDRLSLNKATQDIYFDGTLYDVRHFRDVVFKELSKVLENDKYVNELAYLYAQKNPFHLIENYLNSCVEKHPNLDYHKVFRHLNGEVLHLDLDSLEARYLVKTLVAAVKRIYEPGCQHDTVLVIQGGQGFYKTSFFRELAGRDNFTSTTFHYFNKDELMLCHSKWMIELGEVEGTIKPNTLDKLKAFVTTQIDTFRKPYASQPVDLPRHFILVGTTNKETFLLDETGNRRFWVISVNQKIDINWVKENRDLVWAAAVQAYREDYYTFLNDAEQALSNSINAQKYSEEDVWTEPITNWVLSQTKPFTFSDVMNQVLGKPTKYWRTKERNRVKEILKSLGLTVPKTNSRYNGVSAKWYKPVNVQDVV